MRTSESELQRLISVSGLKVSEVDLLRANSSGLQGVDSLIENWNTNGKPKSIVLGLCQTNLFAVARGLGMTRYDDAVGQFGIDRILKPRLQSLYLLGTIAKDNIPAYFFVPENTFGHRQAYFTANEMYWCLDNPSKLKNFSFVFGLYNIEPMQLQEMLASRSLQ